jgi:hypothetical protein
MSHRSARWIPDSPGQRDSGRLLLHLKDDLRRHGYPEDLIE